MRTSFKPALLFIALAYSLIACGDTTPKPTLTVSISSPSVEAFTKGAVSLQVVVAGAPDSVDLLKDGAVLASLVAPYSYSWDTTTEPEKAYSVTARAKKAGAADVTSAAKQITVDRTPPTLVGRVPASGAVNVFLTDEISAAFSEPLLASSVTTTSAQLKIGTNVVASTATLDTAGTKLLLKPTLLPVLPATITMALGGLTDRAGNALTVPNASFAAPDWQAPGGVQALNAADATQPKIAIGSSGKPVVAWAEAESINVKKWNGTSWDVLATTPGGVDSMVLDSAGNPIISWNQYICCSGEYKYDTFVKKWDGGAWVQLGTALDVNASIAFVNGFLTTSSIAIDSSDNPIVTWSEQTSNSSNIYVKRWNGTAWVQLGSSFLDIYQSFDAQSPSIAVDSSGFPIVSWREFDGNTFNIYVKRWNGSTWIQIGSTPLDNFQGFDANSPSIALDSSGSPVVSWEEQDGTSFNIYVKRWNGSAWVQPGSTFLDVNTDRNASGSAIKVDSSGNPIVSWTEFDGTSFNVYVKRWNGSAWVQVGTASLDANTNSNAVSPSIAIDPSGNPIVTWREIEGNAGNIYVKRLNRITP